MAFTVDVSPRNDGCDKCGQLGTESNPIIRLWQTTRSDKNTIFIHHKCLDRAVTNAIKKATVPHV